MSHFDAALEAELLTQDFRNMYVEWGSNSPLRTGMHASAILDTEFCVREQVLHALSPEQGEKPASNPWDWQRNARFETGWDLHRRWQRVFKQCGNVVYMAVTPEQAAHIPPALLKKIDGQTCAPELDLTHYDSERNLFFSPDAILLFGGEKYVVEIKGIKQESYVELTDDLEQACAVCETVYKAREQCNFYLHLLGLSRGVILIENKNTCDFKVYVIEYEPERALPYSKRLYAVKRDLALARAHGVVASFPVRRCTSSQDRRALSCPMRTVCFSQS